MSAAGPQPGLPEPLVACILVTWNGWQHTSRCLQALEQQSYTNLLVIVVDNASEDGTVQQLRSIYPSVLCIENASNAGFARACNAGAALGLTRGASYLWFLNNDTEPPPDTLTRLVTRAQQSPRIGIVGAVLFYLHDPKRVQAWGGGSISLWSGYNRHHTGRGSPQGHSYITFASALVRAQAFAALGGLWEEIFLYFEDSDFSLRAVQAGWQLAVAEDTAILHAEGASAGRGSRPTPLQQKIQTRSGVLFLRRHGAVPVLPVLLFLLLRLGRRIARQDWFGLGAVLGGARQGWRVPRSRIRPVRRTRRMS